MLVPSPEQAAVYALFGYEAYGGKHSFLWTNPEYFSQPTGESGQLLDENFSAWIRTKRSFTKEEIITGTWVKIGDQGYSFFVTCNTDGTVSEQNLFDEQSMVSGTWELAETGVLITHILHYKLVILANKTGLLHSGVEFSGKQYAPGAYFKVIHLL